MRAGSERPSNGGNPRYLSTVAISSASALRGSTFEQIRQRLPIPAAILATAILIVVVAHGIVLLPSLGSPMHFWSDFALLFLSLFTVIAAGLLWIKQLHSKQYHQSLKTACDRLERVMVEHSKSHAQSNAMWLALFNAYQERVVVVDRDDRIVQANQFTASQLRYNPTGRGFSEVFPPCEIPTERRCELRLIHHTFLDREPQRGRLIRGGVQCQSLLCIDTYPVCDSDGVAQMVIEIARDVTKKIEDDMRHQHQDRMAALGMLAAGFAHDLGNPLASLSSELQLLRHEQDTGRIRDSLSILDRHVDRISRTLRDILNFARRRSRSIGNVAVPLVVRDALRLVQHDPRRADISVHVDLPDNLPCVLIGEDDLLLVLINLILNAFDAMPDGGRLSIDAESTASGGVSLMVRDNGTGMDEALVRNATETLYTTKGESAGTGLGLPLCIEIVQAAGGRLDIWSKQAEGTLITLEFPPITDPGKEEERNGREHSDR